MKDPNEKATTEANEAVNATPAPESTEVIDQEVSNVQESTSTDAAAE